MATTNADFKVKKGLQVEGGDIHLGTGQDGSLSTDNRTGTNVAGRHLTITAGTGTGNEGGGRLDFYTGGAAGNSGSSASTSTLALRLDKDGTANFQSKNLDGVASISADSTSGFVLDLSDGNTGNNAISLRDDMASALNIKQGLNDSYMVFRTTNSDEGIELFKDVEFSNSRNHTLDVQEQTGNNTTGKNLTISAGAGSGTEDGGQLIFQSTGSGSGTSGNTATTKAMAMKIFPAGTVQIPYVDINGGSIDNTAIGSNAESTARFTNLTVIKGGWTRINGTARETNSKLQVNGDDANTSNNANGLGYVEARLHTDIANDDISGVTYADIGNMFLLDNAEDAPGTGQGVMFTVGRGSGVGDHFGVGRVIQGGSATEHFGIGYNGTNYDDTPNANAALLPANLMFELDTSGNASLSKANATLEFNSNTSSNQTTKIKGSPSASASVTYTLPPAAPSGNNYVLQSSTAGVMSWAQAAGGADGMGSGFQLEDNAGTEVTIDESKEVKFLDGGGIDATWTDTSNGTDADPYDLTFTLDINGLTAAAIASGDMIAFSDEGSTNDPTRKESIDDVATLFAGTGLSASSAVLSVDAAQTQITSVGALTGLSTAAAASVDINGADVDITATTLSIDSTDTTNLTMTANVDAAKTLTIDASNSNSGSSASADIKIGTTSATAVTIGHSTSEVTVGDNLTVVGDLTVNGTQTIVNSTTLTFDDKNIELAHSPSGSEGDDAAVDGGGITLKSSDSDKTFNWVNSTDAWTSSEHLNIASGKKFMIDGNAVFDTSTTITNTVTSAAGLATVGDLNSGSITSGFGSINNGSSAITTIGTITGGVLVADNLQLDGNVLSSTNSNGNITLTPNGNGLVNIAKDDLAIAGTAVTTTAAELNVLDGVTAGTVTASLGVVVDSNKDIGSFRNVTATGTIQGGILSADAVAIVDSSRGSGTSLSGATTLATYDVSTYKTAKYVYQIKKDDAEDTDVGEILVTYGVTNNDVYLTEYAMLSTGSSIGAWTADYNSGDTTVRLRFTPTTNGTHTYSIMNTLLIA